MALLKKKKNYNEMGDVPQSEIDRMKQEQSDKADQEAYLKSNPDMSPSSQPYKNNAEYLKEEELNRERMKRSKRYSETLRELENPRKKAD
jgi:hypothetical protein